MNRGTNRSSGLPVLLVTLAVLGCGASGPAQSTKTDRFGATVIEAFVAENETGSTVLQKLYSIISARDDRVKSWFLLEKEASQASFSLSFKGGTLDELVELLNQRDPTYKWRILKNRFLIHPKTDAILIDKLDKIEMRDEYLLAALSRIGDVYDEEYGRGKLLFGTDYVEGNMSEVLNQRISVTLSDVELFNVLVSAMEQCRVPFSLSIEQLRVDEDKRVFYANMIFGE